MTNEPSQKIIKNNFLNFTLTLQTHYKSLQASMNITLWGLANIEFKKGQE